MSTALGLAMQISANTAQLASSIKDVNAKLDSMAAAGKKAASDLAVLKTIELSRVFATSLINATQGFSSFVAGSAAAVASVDDLSKRTGVSAQTLQAYQFAAEQSGVSVETFGKGIQKLGVNLGEAQTGNKSAAKAFTDLGLSVAELSNLSPEVAFEKVAAAISQLPNPAQQAAAAVSLFGKSGVELVPVFQEGAGYLAEMRAEAEKLGIVLNKDQVRGLATLDDSIQKVSASFKAFGARVVAELAPQLMAATDSALAFISSIDVKEVASAASAAVGGLVSVAKAAADAFLILYQGTAPLANAVLPAIADFLGLIANNFQAASIGALAATGGLIGYSVACGGAAVATGALTAAVTALLSSTGIGVLVVGFGAIAGALVSYASSANTANTDAAQSFEQAQAAVNATFAEVEEATDSVKRFGEAAKASFKLPAEITDETLLQGTVDAASQAFRKFAQEAGTLANVPKDVADAFESLQVAIDNVNRDVIDQAVGQQLIADAASDVLSLIGQSTEARAAEKKATEDVAAAARKANEDARNRVNELAQSVMPESEKSRLKLMQDMLAIQTTLADAEQQLADARAAGDEYAIAAAEERLRIARQTATVATDAAKQQARDRELAAMRIEKSLLTPAKTVTDQFVKVRQAFDRGLIDGGEARQALQNVAAEGIAIRKEIAAELARPSQQALKASDIRTSDGASQLLALATGREDPAIGQRRQQLAKLEEIRQGLIAVGASPVDILGGA